MLIDLAKIDFAPGQGGGGGGQKPETTFDVNPTTSDQSVNPPSGSVFSGGVVRGVTSAIDSNISSGNIKDGVTILGVTGDYTGNVPAGTVSISSNGTHNISQYEYAEVSVPQGIVPTGTVTLSSNGTYNVSTYEYAEVSISGAPRDYRYKTGAINGLADLGWDADSIGYAETNIPHYGWEDPDYAVSQANKDLYGVVNADNCWEYVNNPDMRYLPYYDTDGGDYYYAYFFDNFTHLEAIPILDQRGFQNATDMTSMFSNCNNLKTIPPLDTSNITNMNAMFFTCNNLKTIPYLDTSNVTNMMEMFYNCSNLETIPLLDTGNVTDMTNMFGACQSLKAIPLLDTGNVTNMTNMFSGCQNLETIPLLDTSGVASMRAMFYSCFKLKEIPLLDTSGVDDMAYMFYSCNNLKTIPPLDTSGASKMEYMFFGCNDLFVIPALNTELVDEMGYMFNSSGNGHKGLFINGIDFSSISSYEQVTYMFNTYAKYVFRMIVNGFFGVDFTNANYFINRLTHLDYDSVKSILQAMYRTPSNSQKNMRFGCKVYDPQGEIAQLITDCGTKGWTVTGLTFLNNAYTVSYTGTNPVTYDFDSSMYRNSFGSGVNFITNSFDFTTGQGEFCFDAPPTRIVGYDLFGVSNTQNNLTGITIPSTVTEIGQQTFVDCINLQTFTIPSSVTTIGEEAFVRTGITSVTIPSSVQNLGINIFGECNNLQTVTVNCSTISDGMFTDCHNLTTVNLSNSVIHIGDNAFYADNISSVTIPSGVTYIGDYAFMDNPLTSVTVEATTPPTIVGGSTFPDSDLVEIRVPAAALGDYQNDSEWGWYSQYLVGY